MLVRTYGYYVTWADEDKKIGTRVAAMQYKLSEGPCKNYMNKFFFGGGGLTKNAYFVYVVGV